MRITGLSVAILAGCLGWAILAARGQEPAAPTSPTLAAVPTPAPAPPEAVEPPKTTPPVEEIPPEPIPEQPQAQEGLVAPLGLTDVHYLLQRVQLLMESNTTTEQLSRYQREAVFCLDQSRRYLEQVARGLTESVTYKWIAVDNKRIRPGASQYREISPSKPIDGVMALRLRIREALGPSRLGSVFVEEVEITDPAGDITTQTVNHGVAPNLPRHEVVYLDHPVEMKTLRVRVRQDGTRIYRLYVEAGVPDPPDYPREIAVFLRNALIALEKGNLPVGLEQVVRARERLGEFQEYYAPPHKILKNRKIKIVTEAGEHDSAE